VAVIGVKDAKWGERPRALVVLKPGTSGVDAETIKQHMSAYVAKGVISKFGIPDRILFIDVLPKTSVGKLDKKTMRDKYGSA
jgi:fatty-acyl-CoA synthase